MKAFIAKKVLKLSNKGRLIQLDGDLLQGNINNGGVTWILCDQLTNYEYEVFPAERKQEGTESKWGTEPYAKDYPKGKKSNHQNWAYVEIPQWPVKQELALAGTKPPTILNSENHVPESTVKGHS
jgi:hypothetical protein